MFQGIPQQASQDQAKSKELSSESPFPGVKAWPTCSFGECETEAEMDQITVVLQGRVCATQQPCFPLCAGLNIIHGDHSPPPKRQPIAYYGLCSVSFGSRLSEMGMETYK